MEQTAEQVASTQGASMILKGAQTRSCSSPVPGRTVDTAVGRSCADHRRPIASSTNPQLRTHDRLSGTHTLKHRPELPDRFGCLEDAHAFCTRFFRWYNQEHRHSGIGFHTPADVHYGRAELVRAHRARVLADRLTIMAIVLTAAAAAIGVVVRWPSPLAGQDWPSARSGS
jgi:putative transposase